jgi:tRNA 2-thiouridine synthesizing protein A
MATTKIDATGLKCPQPILKITAALPKLAPGEILEVSGDCPTFEQDVRKWCDRMKKTLLAIRPEGDAKVVQIQI